MESKPWYASRTIWVTLVAAIAAVLSIKGVDIAPEEQAQWVAAIMTVIGIVMRFITKQPISA